MGNKYIPTGTHTDANGVVGIAPLCVCTTLVCVCVCVCVWVRVYLSARIPKSRIQPPSSTCTETLKTKHVVCVGGGVRVYWWVDVLFVLFAGVYAQYVSSLTQPKASADESLKESWVLAPCFWILVEVLMWFLRINFDIVIVVAPASCPLPFPLSPLCLMPSAFSSRTSFSALRHFLFFSLRTFYCSSCVCLRFYFILTTSSSPAWYSVELGAFPQH